MSEKTRLIVLVRKMSAASIILKDSIEKNNRTYPISLDMTYRTSDNNCYFLWRSI